MIKNKHYKQLVHILLDCNYLQNENIWNLRYWAKKVKVKIEIKDASSTILPVFVILYIFVQGIHTVLLLFQLIQETRTEQFSVHLMINSKCWFLFNAMSCNVINKNSVYKIWGGATSGEWADHVIDPTQFVHLP